MTLQNDSRPAKAVWVIRPKGLTPMKAVNGKF